MKHKVALIKSLILFSLCVLCSCSKTGQITTKIRPEASAYDLVFERLSDRWDEAIPLGNGMVGALVWKKDGKLRFSLDRADLWDLRPMENLNTPEWKYSWVYDQWKKNDYEPVQEKFDVPYDRSPAPSKIPGAALEFDISTLGEVESVHLYLKQAICEVKWKNGVKLLTFVHATQPVGWYQFEGLEETLEYDLIPPAYNLGNESGAENPVTGQDLRRLDYPEGKVSRDKDAITYEQEGWGGFKYQVNVGSKIEKGVLKGCWSISSTFPKWEEKASAYEVTTENLNKGMVYAYDSHLTWWKKFWSKSAIQVPDPVLQKQWYLEQYKFGSAARVGAPPISLQAVWTADNGKLPPWKGDFHHDLNTQLSYWPAYSGNHLEEEIGFVNWLWKYRNTFKRYTSEYYDSKGLNVPGVTTLTGEPMGGWIQYSFGPTVSAWLAQHFYLHWRYSMDREFLRQRAYPWIKDVAIYLENISVLNAEGMRQLPISSSPEIHDNSINAWFGETTNFDLALIRWTYEKAAELATEIGKKEEAEKWKNLLSQWPDLVSETQRGLMFAPNVPYDQSHRHFSHLVGYHPLGIIDFSKGELHKSLIQNTISTLDKIGSDYWVGYSFSWLGNLKARALDGNGAAEALKIFAENFCLPNSFHVNGDQSGKGYSKFTYRPFTLEGNFAFAAGLQEMLLQSHTGVVRIFPAIPEQWEDVSFDQLRTEGAFLISAGRTSGQVTNVQICSEKGGTIQFINPFDGDKFTSDVAFDIKGDLLIVKTVPGQRISFKKKEEL
ncbi:hypothetical protein QQ008_12300 [Fulvivirgaceae bacterium BMA10]|uniref:Glycosyl hydrolase family 95 N-terminal domain-containing protein n=1 Tax=Splendidivirga corallicola TaxID=3051826 RepID=A0ABT8KN52_9BACT|nr:hypothetical protein [Fulvivirgaceae bacterium BMA10]